MTEPTTLLIDWMGRPHTSNDERRQHWRQLSITHKRWREAGAQAAQVFKVPRPMPPCIVTFQGVYENMVLPDVGAIAPTAKCILDGLVDAGVWPDDKALWVPEERYLAPRGNMLVTGIYVTLTPVAAAVEDDYCWACGGSGIGRTGDTSTSCSVCS